MEAATNAPSQAESVPLPLKLQQASWSITSPRVFDILSPASTVLVAGCGGGYDVLSGLPLYFALRRLGKTVILANLSFSNLHALAEAEFCENCVRVRHDMKLKRQAIHGTYFPEYYLVQWFKERFAECIDLYAFRRETGVKQLRKAYSKICKQHSVDAIVLVDGGTDSLMFGFEECMGTPEEDQSSITAVHLVETVNTKLLLSIGFGVDSFHGVSHGLFLENVAALEKKGGYHGCFSVPQHSVEGGLYMEAYSAVSQSMQCSIVCACITDAMKGEFGNHHSTDRTGGSKLFINPLMPIYWCFDLTCLAQQIPYVLKLEKTSTAFEVHKVISSHSKTAQENKKIRGPIPLPM